MTDKTPTFTTDRLIARPLRVRDAPELFAIYSDPEAMRFMPDVVHNDVIDTERMLVADLACSGAIHWAICRRDDERLIGQMNYLGQTRVPGFGYILSREYWGRGFMVEAVRPALDYGFRQLGMQQIELWIDTQNTRSQRVAEKLGFQVRGSIQQRYPHRSEAHTMQVFGLWADEWDATLQAPLSGGPFFFRLEPVLLVPDLLAALDYFCARMGFHEVFRYGEPPVHAAVSSSPWSGGGITIQLSQGDPDGERKPAAYLYLFTDSRLDQIYAGYREAGVEIVQEPKTMPWGMREFAVQVPGGHELRFGGPA
ncbi:MAG: GNAT family N-acetyltransferase [Oscillochloris sp.]|nr:GNAT family N-acetyltransferase [Oscillochloris sp.]